MGDADGEVVIPAQEIEAWMDEALAVVDEGLGNLLTLVANLNERTNSILQELKIIESFRKIFIALNFFIVPVVFAIMLCYGTKESVNSNVRGIEAALQMLVLFLMFLSSSVGLPFYIISIYESYKISENINEETNDQSITNESTLFNESLMTLLTNESSVERLNDFARMLNDRMPQRMRVDLQRRRNTESDSSEQRNLSGMEDSSEVEMESAITDASNSAEPSDETIDDYSNNPEQTPTPIEFPILYQFQVLMREQSPDLSVRFEPTNNDGREITEYERTMELDTKESSKSQEGSLSIAEKKEDCDAFPLSELHTCSKEGSLSLNQLRIHKTSC